jgi:pyruvate,water dikinase
VSLDGVESAAPVRFLRETARVHAPVPRRLGLVGSDWTSAAAVLGSDPAGRRALADMEVFLARYGFRGVNEAEIFGRRWRERPELIWDTLRRLAAAPPREEAARAAPLPASVSRRLVPPLARPVWPLLVRETRRYLRLRENTRAGVTAVFGELRRLVSEIGVRGAERGLLPRREDVFFLSLVEAGGLLGGQTAEGVDALRQRILTRKRRRAWWLSCPAPPEVFTEGDLSGSAMSPGTESADGSGIPVSVGVVEGPARVLTDPESPGRFEPGSILIVPYINPGWAPVLALAGGVVAERGGMMSHGAIIVRELAIPAIVGVRGASTRIRDGDRVRLDGTRGEVRLVLSDGSTLAVA